VKEAALGVNGRKTRKTTFQRQSTVRTGGAIPRRWELPKGPDPRGDGGGRNGKWPLLEARANAEGERGHMAEGMRQRKGREGGRKGEVETGWETGREAPHWFGRRRGAVRGGCEGAASLRPRRDGGGGWGNGAWTAPVAGGTVAVHYRERENAASYDAANGMRKQQSDPTDGGCGIGCEGAIPG